MLALKLGDDFLAWGVVVDNCTDNVFITSGGGATPVGKAKGRYSGVTGRSRNHCYNRTGCFFVGRRSPFELNL